MHLRSHFKKENGQINVFIREKIWNVSFVADNKSMIT